jgi:hypothetical protein
VATAFWQHGCALNVESTVCVSGGCGGHRLHVEDGAEEVLDDTGLVLLARLLNLHDLLLGILVGLLLCGLVSLAVLGLKSLVLFLLLSLVFGDVALCLVAGFPYALGAVWAGEYLVRSMPAVRTRVYGEELTFAGFLDDLGCFPFSIKKGLDAS